MQSNTPQVIPADIHIDLPLAQSLVRHDFPQLSADSIRLLGEGWDNLVFVIDDQWVFRFPRRTVAVSLLEQELRVLTALAGKFSLAIPAPQFIGQPSAEYPWPYYGHAIITGTTGCKVSLSMDEYQKAASKLAAALRTLHDLDYANLLPSLATRPFFDRTDFPNMIKILEGRSEPLRKNAKPGQFDRLANVFVEKGRTYQSRNLSLVHGDLYHRHLIFGNDNELGGLIDWGDCGISDPCVDLAVVYQFFTPETHNAFFDIYGPIDDEQKGFAQYLALYYATALYWYGENRNDADLTSTSLKTLDYLDALIP